MADQQPPAGQGAANDKYQIKDVSKFEDGPIQKRSCTDIICWCIFVFGIVWWVTAFIYGLSNGDPKKVFAAWDEDNKQCGYTTGYGDYGYAYFYSVLDTSFISTVYTRVICINKCPTYTNDPTVAQLSTFKVLVIPCKETAASLAVTSTKIIPNYNNPAVMGCTNMRAYKSFAFLGVYCIPNSAWVTAAAQELSGIVSKLDSVFNVLDTTSKWIDDLAIVYPVILGGFGCAILIGIIYCYFMRCCAALITWLIILTLLVVLWVGGALAYLTAMKYQDDITAANNMASAGGTTADTSDDEWTRNWCYFAMGALWLSGFIFLCMIMCFFHRIRLVICIIEASARFINNNLMVLFVPVINVILALLWIAIWVLSVVYLYSVGTVTKNENGYPWSSVAWETYTEVTWYTNLFWGLWVVAFFVSMNVFVIAAAAVIWYFQQGEAQEGGPKSTKNPCCTGYCWAIGWHLGSIAFGSFILAVVWAIQIVMLYIEKKMRDSGAAKNKCVEILFKYVHYCLACFERLIKFLNKQAFIQVALTGENFCSSAWRGFLVVMNHLVDFSLLALIGNGFMFLAVLLVCIGSTFAAWCAMTYTDLFEEASSLWFPVVFVAIIGWMIGKLFASVYMVACYAILQCFYVDVEIQKGANRPPRFTPTELKNFVERAKNS
jgi:hypothetical protein